MPQNFKKERLQMVSSQIEQRGVTSEVVLKAMRQVPRHLFVPSEISHLAYQDCPLPIGYNQTISQPYIVAYMTEHLQLRPTDKVLEIGTGSAPTARAGNDLRHERTQPHGLQNFLRDNNFTGPVSTRFRGQRYPYGIPDTLLQ